MKVITHQAVHIHLFYLMLNYSQLMQTPVKGREIHWPLCPFATIPAPQYKYNKTNQ